MQNEQVVAVIGGGILGVSTATQLARAGTRTILVSDGNLAAGASGRSLSWLNSSGRRSEPYHRLRLAGIERYRALAAQLGDVDWLRFHGGLTWTTPAAAEELLADHRAEVAAGYPSRLLSAAEVATTVPGVNTDRIPEAGAIWNPDEGWVDLPSLIDLLVSRFRAAGGELLVGRARLVTTNDRVSALHLDDGSRRRVDAGVIATGAAAPADAAALGCRLPDATPVAALVQTEPLRCGLTAVLNTPRAALRPAPGGTLSVDSDWVTAHLEQHPDRTWSLPAPITEELLGAASAALAGGPRLRAARTLIGPKPVPADGEPVLGPLPGVDGAYVAFTHSGATLGLIAGELLAGYVRTGERPALLDAFTPARFCS